MTRRMRWLLGGAGAAVLLLLLAVPLPDHPPGDTRVILDHTLRVYAAPPCFDQADLTNYLTETTWDKAQESGYGPESACTADKLKPVSSTLWNRIGIIAGFHTSPWSW